MSECLLVFWRRFALELLLYFFLPVLFLCVYIVRFDAPLSSFEPHLSLIAATVLPILIARYLLYRFGAKVLASWFSSVLGCGLIIFLANYYLVIVVGVEVLGRVVSWPLIKTYFLQISEVLEVLGVPVVVVLIVYLLFALLVVVSLKRFYEKFDWVPVVSAKGTLGGSVAVLLLLLLMTPLQFWRILGPTSANSGEPIGLTLNPEKGKIRLQTHLVDNRISSFPSDDPDLRVLPLQGRERTTPNVILIVVDALRSDHLPVNGYHRPLTPFLDGLIAAGRMQSLPEVYSTCAESSCGLMSIASSRYVHEFGKKFVTLQEILRGEGYRINMILGGDHTNFYGLRSNYGKVDHYYDGSMATGYYMNDDQFVVDHLKKIPASDGTPEFFQFHLMSVHGLGKRDPEFSPYQPARAYYRDVAIRLSGQAMSYVDEYINSYDNGVLRMDAVLRDIFALLEEKGYMKKAVLMITADHGEMLGEHGRFSHAKELFQPVLRVPMLFMRSPLHQEGKKYLHDDAPVSLVDIAPTILSELGMQSPKNWSGVALQTEWKRARKDNGVIYFQQGSDFGLIQPGDEGKLWKYWGNYSTRAESLFELTSDEAERLNRIGSITHDQRRQWSGYLLQPQAVAGESSEIR